MPTETAFFRDSERARRDLEQLRSRFSDGLLSATVSLLAQCADPDQALNLLERLTASGDDSLTPLFEKNRTLLHHLLTIFGQSYWLGESMAKHPSLVQALAREKHFERSPGHEDFRQNLERFRSRSSETDPSTLLAGFKKREYIRIALRDMLGIATLAETTAELSALADVILECALQEAELQVRARFDAPSQPSGRLHEVKFAVLSLGKLGGNELNYSSDLDLLYIFDISGSTISREQFTRLAQTLTEILCRTTPEGPVFRVDLRLRPQGSQGELATSLQQGIEYYSRDAADWELQALIKLRCSAGDHSLARAFIAGVQPRIYSSSLNFAAIDTALRSRERMSSRQRQGGLVSAHGATVDVKLDRGGIRDVEFLVQCLQRVYGGEEKWLRSGGTLFSLQKLHDKGHISGKDFHELTQAYEFLRRLEHRLQLQRGQQLHRLPAEPEEILILQRAISVGSAAHEVGDLRELLNDHMERVAGIYERIIFSQKRREKYAGTLVPAASSVREMSYDQVLDRIAQDSPALHEVAARPYAIHTRRNLHRFLSSAMTSAERYAELLKNPQAVEKAVVLFSSSDYLTDILVRHPDAIRTLDSKLGEDGTQITSDVEPGSKPDIDPARSLDALRHSFRKSTFSVGARDILAPRSAFTSMSESSTLADEAIRQALSIIKGESVLAVFALGRLGTEEFDIASDADLLFLRQVDTDADAARTTAEKLIHALAAYTREGSIFAVDARLRPHGKQGELVITPAQLERYLADEAQPWEALTYTKLSFVAGREDLGPPVLSMVQSRIFELASKPGFPQAVMEMRTRLEKSNRYAHSFKLARGGFYDVDFIASFLMLRHASLHSGSTLHRLGHLHGKGFLESAEFDGLREAAMLYRTADHVIRLVTGRARPELPEAEHARSAVEDLVCTVLGQNETGDTQQKLNITAERVRAIFRQILES